MSSSPPDSRDGIATIAVAATFTAEPVEAALRFWTEELRIPAKIRFAPYGQVFQQLVDPSSLFSGNRGGTNVLFLRLEDLVPGERPGSGPDPAKDRALEDFLAAVRGASNRASTCLIVLCPSSNGEEPGGALSGSRTQERMAAALREIPGVDVVTTSELLAAYPVREVHDRGGDRLAHVPYTPAFYTALATTVARRMFASRNVPHKVIAVDADQTLWSGVCGEDGPMGVRIDPARRAIQEFLTEQRDAGMVLCLCSKNNEEDVAAVFERRPEMVLKREDIAGWRVNWRPKSENLRSLAAELHLGLESFVFLDDDPVACADVQANCPEVLVLALPEDPEAIAPFLRKIWAFDHFRVTKEAADRTNFYRQDARRREFEMESLTLEDFLLGLGLKVQFAPAAEADLPRAAELTQRTNQFNATTIRRTEADLRSMLRPEGPECLVVRVRDRFGDYGLVGLLIFRDLPGAFVVDTFLLSCRALGRGVEHRMLAKLGEIARQRGAASVDIPFLPSGKNRPALDFLESVGGGSKEARDGGSLFRFPADYAAAVRYAPPAADARGSGPGAAREPSAPAPVSADARATAALLSSIATELSDAEKLAALIAAERHGRPDLDVPYVAPATDDERRLAGMFEELLGVEKIGIHDSFFSLGGHSLLAMMLINRVRDAFDVEFPIAILFESEFTVAKAAQKVAMYRGSPSPDGGAGEVRFVETLSDEDVRTLQAGQSDPVPGRSGGEKA